ncbi:hypothetical protein HAX54_041310 [Datura stramonium]|uniref:DUF7377 domain-containing protein n=1 Tax=Datura stramonium TaxID=4076 RepID=A0ABS8VNW7_DATST|nr:hypothetical protein [Datura stramonium]
MQKRLQRLSRNVSEAIASLKNSLNIESVRDPPSDWPRLVGSTFGVVWSGLDSALSWQSTSEKLVSNIRKHYTLSHSAYGQAGFEMKDVFLLPLDYEQASAEDHPAIMIQEVSDDEVQGSIFKLTFACNSHFVACNVSAATTPICCKDTDLKRKA